MESTRLIGRANFSAVFFFCPRALPNRWCSMNFIGTFRMNAIPKPMMNGNKKLRRTLAVLMTMFRFWTPRYRRTAKAISHPKSAKSMRRKVGITRCAQTEDLFWEFEHYKKETARRIGILSGCNRFCLIIFCSAQLLLTSLRELSVEVQTV